MVVGAGSESYKTLRYLVQRLPAMIAPAWLKTRTQPIAIDDVLDYLAAAPRRSGVRRPRGADRRPGRALLRRHARPDGRGARHLPPPRLPVPLLTPWLSSLWIGLVTPVDAGVARPLIEGLSTETVVTDRVGDSPVRREPTPFDEALRAAIAEDDS